MNLRQSPFLLLGVSVRDRRDIIVAREHAQSLIGDIEACRQARQVLTTPRLRLETELAWLPGVAPRRADALVAGALRGDAAVLKQVDGIPPLAACNALGGLLDSLNPAPGVDGTVESVIRQLLSRFDEVSPAEVLAHINEDRVVAGLPQLTDPSPLESGLKQRQGALAACIVRSLNNLEAPDAGLTAIVDTVSAGGTQPVSPLVAEVVAGYRLEIQGHLETLAQHVSTLIADTVRDLERTEGHLDSLSQRLDKLEQLLRQWDGLVQPVQLVAGSVGSEEEDSSGLADQVRDLSLCLWNKYDNQDAADRLTRLMEELFAELPQTAARLAEDRQVIDRAFQARDAREKKQQAEQEEWEREIHLDLMVGAIPLRISGDGIRYGGGHIRLEDIDRIRWWIFKHYVNGIRVSREFSIALGGGRNNLRIECAHLFERETDVLERFNVIVDKVWRAAGVRLLTTALGRLSKGESFLLGGVQLDRRGAFLTKRKWLKSEVIHVPWTELSINSYSGSFTLEASKISGTRTKLPYRNVDNVHVLEALMRFLWKDGNHARLAREEFSSEREGADGG